MVVIWVERAWLATDLALSTSFWIEVMPWLAAWIACTPLEMPSSRFDRSPDRWSRDCEVKKVTGLSRAEETFLPVASRFLGGGRSATPYPAGRAGSGGWQR